LKHLARHFSLDLAVVLALVLLTVQGSLTALEKTPETGQVKIERIKPERIGGNGYRLVYRVNVPIAVYWKFKTDFDNSFLIDNKFIREHHFISQHDNIAITETQYTYQPDLFFRWQTRIFPERHRLVFSLLNPMQCKQKYHHGYIQLESEGKATRVTQVAYFDFWGATFWVYDPWKGGMHDFLTYTARWEQAMVLHLKDRYNEKNNPEK
jgi:hypothetical protein